MDRAVRGESRNQRFIHSFELPRSHPHSHQVHSFPDTEQLALTRPTFEGEELRCVREGGAGARMRAHKLVDPERRVVMPQPTRRVPSEVRRRFR